MEKNLGSLLLTQSTSQKNRGGFFGRKPFLIALSAFLLIGAWIYFAYVNTPEIPLYSEEKLPAAIPSGVILFTAATDNLSEIYSFDLNTTGAVLQKFPIFPVTAFPEFTNKAIPTKVFFNASTIYASEETDQTGLHSWDISTTTFTYYESASGNTEKDLNWSEAANKLAFFRLKESVGSAIKVPSISDYEIVIMDPKQDVITAVIEGGVYPRWSPTGESLLFFRADGLYQYDVATGIDLKVLGPDDPTTVLTPSEMLAVSEDGSHIVITSQGSGLVTVFSVESWNPLTLRVITTFADDSKFYTAPVISPDTNMYVVLATDKKEDAFINPRFEIRSVQSADIIFSYPLDPFDPQKIFIDDWISQGITFTE